MLLLNYSSTVLDWCVYHHNALYNSAHPRNPPSEFPFHDPLVSADLPHVFQLSLDLPVNNRINIVAIVHIGGKHHILSIK